MRSGYQCYNLCLQAKGNCVANLLSKAAMGVLTSTPLLNEWMGVPLSIVYVVFIIHGRTNLFSMTATISTSLIFTNSTRLHSTRNSLQSPGITPLAWHLLHSPGTQGASQNMRSQPASALMSYRARPLHSTHNFHFGVQNMILHNLCSGYRTIHNMTELKKNVLCFH